MLALEDTLVSPNTEACFLLYPQKLLMAWGETKQLPVCLGVLHDVLVHNDGQPSGPSLDPVSLSGSNSPCCCRLDQGKDEGKGGLWTSLDLML